MASTSLFPRHVGLGLHHRISDHGRDLLSLCGLAGLLLLIPLRHVLLNTDGPATAGVLIGLALLSTAMGLGFEWRSGWCSSLCPVHHVERLYGTRPAVTLNNAQCYECERCVAICPDSTLSFRLAQGRTRLQGAATTLMVGGFVGFIWGWFHVPDYRGGEGFAHAGTAYGLPFGGMAASLLLFLFLRRKLKATQQHRLVLSFTAAAVSCYYWYRLPALLGYGPFPGDGMLFDLRGVLPASLVLLLRATTTILFFWWFLGRDGESRRRWSRRPPLAEPGNARQVTART
jgi:NAD-dependent dihydropyrimidine dehydrogenase PreA subunit